MMRSTKLSEKTISHSEKPRRAHTSKLLKMDKTRKNSSQLQAPKASQSSKLLEKHEKLCLFFSSMERLVKLLKMKGSMSNFDSICPKIEYMTERQFSHRHLAQMKFLLPEAITLRKVHILDEESRCMKPDLCISLNRGAIEVVQGTNLQTKNLDLSKVFRSRLSDFCRTHPEEDIPEYMLPTPFSKSQKHSHTKLEKNSMLSDSLSSEPIGDLGATPSKAICTPPKLPSTPNLMCVTPSANTLKRSGMTSNECSSSSLKKSSTRRSARALNFDTPVEDEDKGLGCLSPVDASLDISESLLSSIREKEKKGLEDQNPVISEVRRQSKMHASLPKLFNNVYSFFVSPNRSVVIKEKLVYSIIRSLGWELGEAEEHLKLLERVVPEWIYERVGLGGDCLVCINKGCSPATLRAKLTEKAQENMAIATGQ